jgi:YidC/Oxa1 family membrane protein insertase
MDTQRLILFVVFSFSLLMLWEAWQKEMRPAVPAGTATTQAVVPTPSALGEAPQAKGVSVPPSPAQGEAGPRELLKVSTDFLRVDIDTRGGDIQLPRAAAAKRIRATEPEHRAVRARAPLRRPEQAIGTGLPNHRTAFRAQGKEFSLAPGQDKIEVRLEASGPQGVTVAKILTFHRGSYRIDVAEEIVNGTSEPLAADAYFQLTRDGRSAGGDPYMTQTYTGGAVYTEHERFQKSRSTTSPRGRWRTRRPRTTAGSR